MTSLSTKELLIELEALKLRLELDQADPGTGEIDDPGLIQAAIQRLQQLDTYQRMAGDQ
jgi:hypothetical protein